MKVIEPDCIEKRLLAVLRFGIIIVTVSEIPQILANKFAAKIAQRKEEAKQEQVLRKTLLFCFLGYGRSPHENNE
jgi:hypothetical protein